MVRFIKFAVIGGAATLLQFLFLWVFVEFMGMPPTLASATSYCCSAVFNYLANYHFTFNSNSSHIQTLPKFAVTVAMGMALSTTLFALSHYLLIHFFLTNTILLSSAYLIAQLFATLLTLIANFLMHKFWIYKKP